MIAEEKDRRGRLQQLTKLGLDPFPARVERTHTVGEFLEAFKGLEASSESASVVGRVRAVRKHGRLAFARVEDETGILQVMLREDELGEDEYRNLLENLDVADFLEVSGGVIVTKTGEESLLATKARIIAKAILPLPEKWHGLSDVEIRFRQRELDLIVNKDVRNVFVARARILTTMRRFLDDRGFLEVDTPVLQHVAAGASAKPFISHHNALDEEVYMRIAPELFLKRCVIGGYERVYEIARCFRNEGMSHIHNPEFSQLELYAAYMDYTELMDMYEEMLRAVIEALELDASSIEFDGHKMDFSKPFPRVVFRDAIFEESGIDVDLLTTKEGALRVAKEGGVEVEDSDSLMTIIDNIWKQTTRPKIVQPTFIMDHPAAITPLAKKKADGSGRIEMFQLVLAGGVEACKAFTELNDPVDQEERMNEQEEAHNGGDDEAQRKDEEFLLAMKHGMPPMAGIGIGIERLTQILTNSQNIKEVILFPLLRSKTEELDSKGPLEA